MISRQAIMCKRLSYFIAIWYSLFNLMVSVNAETISLEQAQPICEQNTIPKNYQTTVACNSATVNQTPHQSDSTSLLIQAEAAKMPRTCNKPNSIEETCQISLVQKCKNPELTQFADHAKIERQAELAENLTQATHYLHSGLYETACDNLRQALNNAEAVGNKTMKATVFSEIGELYLASQQTDSAAFCLEKAKALAQETQQSDLQATIYNKLGNLMVMTAEYEPAIQNYLESERLAPINDTLLQAKVKTNLLEATLLQAVADKSFRDASADLIKKWLEATSITQNLPLSSAQLSLSLALSRLGVQLTSELWRQNLPAYATFQQQVHSLLQRITKFADQQNDKVALAYSYGYLGKIYELANRYDDALLLTRKAIFTAEATKESAFLVKDVIFQWYWQWARLLKKLNLLEKAIAIYQLAISHFQPIRQQVVNTGYRQRQTLAKSYRQEEEVHFSFALYYELIDLLLSQYERHADFKQRQEVLQQLLYVLEKIRKNELRDSFQDICVNLDSKQLDRRIEEFLRSQRENAEWSQIAVIYPILLSAFASQDVGSERRERAEWLVSLPTGIMTLIPMQIPNLQPKKERLQTDVVSFKNKLVSSGKSSAKNYQDNAKKLYDWLIKPLEDEFNKQQLKINTLVMVPDAILREIPLAALYDGHHFLVEKYAVAVTQGLALTDPMQFSHREERRVLLGGVSEEREFDGQKFSSLPSVRHELQSLSELFNEQPYYLDKQFTMQLFETELKSNRHHILHISSHGEFKPNRILDGFVLTYDGKVTLAAIERWLKTSESSVELLTLNACETAKGGSQAMLGLAGVTVQLGIKTTLANLWQVEDSSASELSEAFYQNIQKVELSLAEALRQAQLMLLHGGYKQPYYWAPMILVGNWF